MINLKNISKKYTSQQTTTNILQNISLTINGGEMLAIMGKSGSGKSTLLHILGTLDQLSEGEYWFKEKNIAKLNQAELALFRNKFIGFVFQSYFLLPQKNALQNVMLPLLYCDHVNFDGEQRAKEMLIKVGMGDRLHHKPNQLSGGQCQRIAIARALINQPSVILADEPTGALDSTTSKEVLSLFHHLNREGQTIIMVTHDQYIADQCKRTIQIHDGKIVPGTIQ